jgi:hypothetical protein
MTIEQAYAKAVEKLRSDPHYAIPVPTLLDVAAFYRRGRPETRLAEVRAAVLHAHLMVADVG